MNLNLSTAAPIYDTIERHGAKFILLAILDAALIGPQQLRNILADFFPSVFNVGGGDDRLKFVEESLVALTTTLNGRQSYPILTNKIDCIKYVRKMTGWGLKETKDFVEDVACRYHIDTLNHIGRTGPYQGPW